LLCRKTRITVSMKSPMFFLIVATMIGGGHAHAYLYEPQSRNIVRNKKNDGEYCPHCGQGGGPNNVGSRAGGVYPSVLAVNSHGLCGDPFQGQSPTEPTVEQETYMQYTTEPQRTYTGGDVVEFVIGVGTHHMGHFEFRLCEQKIDTSTSREDGQACLNEHVLERADPDVEYGNCVVNDERGDCQPLDPNHPGRWHMPPPNQMVQVAGEHWSDDLKRDISGDLGSLPASGQVFYMRYKIPASVSCAHCTLQWYWATGNSCMYDTDYSTYFKMIATMGWNSAAWSGFALTNPDKICTSSSYGEEFWNCADIAVLPGGPTPPPTPAPPTPAPPPTPPTPVPTPEPTASGAGFCCWWPNSGDVCGSCTSWTDNSEWCGESESKCVGCGGDWCGADPPAPPTPAPAPTTAPEPEAETESEPETETEAESETETETESEPETETEAETESESETESETETEDVGTPAPTSSSFCCWWSTDNSCGTCQSYADSNSWCGESQTRCVQCAGTWCGGGSTMALDTVLYQESAKLRHSAVNRHTLEKVQHSAQEQSDDLSILQLPSRHEL